jgi:hypothetical protein
MDDAGDGEGAQCTRRWRAFVRPVMLGDMLSTKDLTEYGSADTGGWRAILSGSSNAEDEDEAMDGRGEAERDDVSERAE